MCTTVLLLFIGSDELVTAAATAVVDATIAVAVFVSAAASVAPVVPIMIFLLLLLEDDTAFALARSNGLLYLGLEGSVTTADLLPPFFDDELAVALPDLIAVEAAEVLVLPVAALLLAAAVDAVELVAPVLLTKLELAFVLSTVLMVVALVATVGVTALILLALFVTFTLAVAAAALAIANGFEGSCFFGSTTTGRATATEVEVALDFEAELLLVVSFIFAFLSFFLFAEADKGVVVSVLTTRRSLLIAAELGTLVLMTAELSAFIDDDDEVIALSDDAAALALAYEKTYYKWNNTKSLDFQTFLLPCQIMIQW